MKVTNAVLAEKIDNLTEVVEKLTAQVKLQNGRVRKNEVGLERLKAWWAGLAIGGGALMSVLGVFLYSLFKKVFGG